VAVLREALGDDAEAVAALLRHAAMGIPDTDGEMVRLSWGREEFEDAVAADPAMAIANQPRCRRI